MNDREKLASLRLIRTENVGPITYYKLLSRFGTAEKALEALPHMSRRGGRGKDLVPYAVDLALQEIEKVEKFGGRMLVKGEDAYPDLLGEVEDAPPVVTVLGDVSVLSKKALGVVGARNASIAGRKVTEIFSSKVAQAGYVIVSGLARGIDTVAHGAALQTGTVAVVAGGIDVVYPRENEKLYRDITENGAVIAESPFGVEPIARHFPKRNRIISGLSQGVLLVEAAARSGSLITARMALEQNREVFAVPGSPLDGRSEGTNGLLRDGAAHVATCADDILQVLHSLRFQPLRDSARESWQGPPADLLFAMEEERETGQETTRIRVLENLSPTPVSVDELVRAVDAPVSSVMSIILEYELAGRIERQAGNKVNLI